MLLVFSPSMVDNFDVTLGVFGSKSTIELKEVKKLAKVLGFYLQVVFYFVGTLDSHLLSFKELVTEKDKR